MKYRKVETNSVICDTRSLGPKSLGCHTEIVFSDNEIIWAYEENPNKITLKEAFPNLEEMSLPWKFSEKHYTSEETGYIICPVCKSKLPVATREIYLSKIKESYEHKGDLRENISFYKTHMNEPLYNLTDSISCSDKIEYTPFVHFVYGEFHEIS